MRNKRILPLVLVGLCLGSALQAQASAATVGFQSAASAASAASLPGSATQQEAGLRSVEAKDESIYILQRRSFTKKRKIEITPILISGLNPKFVGYFGGGVSAAYHLRENLAIELVSSLPWLFYAFHSDLVIEVYRYQGLTPESVDLKQMSYFSALSMQLSALYGKLRFYDSLIDYDFYASAGLGLVRTVETCNPLEDGCGDTRKEIGRGMRSPEDGTDRSKLSANLGAGMRLFFSDRFGLRLEIRDVTYADRAVDRGSTTTDIRNNLLLFLGASVML